MRQISFAVLVSVLAILPACGDDRAHPDAGRHIDAAVADGARDGQIDGPINDAPPTAADQIAAARATAPGTGLTLPITSATVTYLKPQIGSVTNDPAGFTIQATQAGPALFVSVDPTTLTPAPAVGDVVSFTITTMGTVGQQPRAQAISDYTRISTGADVTLLTKTVSSATDLVSTEADYDSELVTITGTVFEAFTASGSGFVKAGISTAGITGDVNLQLRAPSALVSSLDIESTCTVIVHNVPVSRFNAQTQINAYSAGDLLVMGCPAPTVVSAVAQSATSLRLTFSRNVLAGTVMADGSQFTFDHGLVASAATVSGNTVTVTTSAQVIGTTYTTTVAATVTDLQGTGVGTPNTAMFPAFVTPAVLRINELNATVLNGCDLIELRAVSAGSIGGFTLLERNATLVTLPNMTVAKNDFIVIHMSSANTTNCNPGSATQELTSPTDQPAATFIGNFDNAYDIWSLDTGLTDTDNVFTLLDANATIIDALFVSDDPAAVATASATETQAAIVGAANQWSPMLVTYIDDVFRTNAADDLDATGTTATGNSIQRVDNNDTNGKADWTTGGGAAATWGGLNPNQTAF